MKTKKIRIIIADDHSIFREGLKIILKAVNRLEVAGEAANGEELIACAAETVPDVILTDIKMPLLDGIQATRDLCARFPGCRIIGLSMYSEEHLIVEMLEAGAQGYLLKSAASEEVVTAIETVYARKPYFSQEITESMTKIIVGRQVRLKENRHAELTELEKQIMQLICKEMTSKQIADILRVNKRTIESYRMRIMDKIGARSVAGIITFALEKGIAKPE